MTALSLPGTALLTLVGGALFAPLAALRWRARWHHWRLGRAPAAEGDRRP